jgi:hypothetical protein
MLILELFGISLVLGVVGGVSWRLYEDWQEKREAESK